MDTFNTIMQFIGWTLVVCAIGKGLYETIILTKYISDYDKSSL